MNDDIFESVSQGSDGAYDEENRRIQEVSNELQRLCRLHEAQLRDGQEHVSRFDYLTILRYWLVATSQAPHNALYHQ